MISEEEQAAPLVAKRLLHSNPVLHYKSHLGSGTWALKVSLLLLLVIDRAKF